jgi:hypothetical protein
VNITLTNKGALAVPVASIDEGGWAEELQADETMSLDRPATDVIIVGEKAGFFESMRDAVGSFVDFVEDLIYHWRKRHEAANEGVTPLIVLMVENHGSTAVLVKPGNGPDFHLSPGETQSVNGLNYVELRELASAEETAAQEQATASEDQAG